MAISSNGVAGLRTGVCTSTTRPTGPYEGQMIYETDTRYTLQWDGTAWRTVGFANQYKIGDTGPAGGTIIFVDYLNQFSTFNYIELAPKSTEVYRQWCVAANTTTSVGTTKLGIGEGQANTALIIAQSGNNVSATVAAAYCDALSSGGYSDWYLPSIGELIAWQRAAVEADVVSGIEFILTYWASSEQSSDMAHGANNLYPRTTFNANSSKSDPDTGDPWTQLVRAVRRF